MTTSNQYDGLPNHTKDIKLKENHNEFSPDSSSEEIKKVIENLVQENIDYEELNTEESLEAADRGWVDFGDLIKTINEKVEKNNFVSAALEFIKEKNGYLVNAGLSMLGLENSISFFKEQNRQKELIDLFLEYIPSEDEIISTNPRDAAMYNFYMSVEGLLNLDQEELLNKILTEKHEEILNKCCETPDMKGTKIFEKYGEN